MNISLGNIDNGNPFDWGRASSDYARYRDIYPEAFYEKLAELSLGVKGQKVLDLGTGTGVIPRNMYIYGAKWVGADISENQIEYARLLSQEQSKDIEYVVASAETFNFPESTFDVVTACQCFIYFDKAVALPRIHKVLKKDGHFAVLFMAWLPYENEIAGRSEELVLKYNPSWSGGGRKRYEVKKPDWCGNMFEAEHLLAFDLPVTFTRENWHGRMKACRGIGASSLSEKEIASWEEEHLAYMKTVPEVFEIPHYVSILDLKKI